MKERKSIGKYRKDAIWDKRISFYVIYYFIASALNATIKHVFTIGGSWYSGISALVGVSIVFFMMIPVREVLRRSGSLLMKVVGLFIIVYLISILMTISRGEPVSILLRHSAFLSFAWWIPVGVCACSVYDKRILYETGLKGSFVISILMVILWFASGSGDYSMFLGFTLILPLLFHLNELFKTRKLFYLLLSLFELFMIVAFANRGVLLSVIVFLLFKIVFETKSLSRKTIATIVVSLTGLVLTFFYEQIILFLIDAMASVGVVSRTLYMAMADNIADDSGRLGIWRICENMIYEKPLLGWGLGGEFYEIAQRMGAFPEEIGQGYSPHNGLIQNFVNFGIIGGLIASMIVIIPVFSTKKVKDIYARHLVIIFICATIIPCFVSADGLFTKPEVAVALFLFYRRNNNNIIRKNEFNY